MKPKPPKIAYWFLKISNKRKNRDIILGDFEEFFYEIYKESGAFKAAFWYWKQTFKSIPMFIKPIIYWRISMFINYFKLALRNIQKHKGYSFINIAGLAIGLACCILILMWVKDELSYDRHFEKADYIYRLITKEEFKDHEIYTAMSPYIAGLTFTSEIPEIETYTRMMPENARVIADGKTFDESDIFYADPDFFKIFSFPFIAGDSQTALIAPGSMVLTAETAQRLFGRTDVVGKTLNFNRINEFRITGVIRDIPQNTHFKFSSLLSFSTFENRPQTSNILKTWFLTNGWCYLLLGENANPETVEKKMMTVTKKYGGAESPEGNKQEFRLQNIKDVHLKSQLSSDISQHGNIRYVYTFSLIAVFILIIACINFMNLTTARSVTRSKEVGLRKVLGAHRGKLICQFLGESVLMVLLSLLGAITIVSLVLPFFNQFTDKSLSLTSLVTGNSWIGLVLLVLLTGMIAGIYPAVSLSGFRPAAVLKGTLSKGNKPYLFRNILVIFQFTISILLITATLIMFRQLQYMQTRDLGFDKDQVLVVNIMDADEALRTKIETLKAELLRNPKILNGSLTDGLPGDINLNIMMRMEGRPEGESRLVNMIIGDFDFARTYAIKIIEGRDFSRKFGSDEKGVFLINETAAREFDWGLDAIGRKIGVNSKEMGDIVGIMKDFHFKSLKEKIGPLAVWLSPRHLKTRGYYLSLKIRGGDIARTVDSVKSKWTGWSDGTFDYFFADDHFDALYRDEKRTSLIITVFAFMSIFVACLGLFGLASYTTEQRTREIGVRKVLGASELGLVTLISKEFIKRVLVANGIALPAAYVIMVKSWLSHFAYRTSPGPGMFVFVAGISLLIALSTVIYQTVKVAFQNPVDALRYE
jgi:putative ABC transport system permease protein